MNSKIEQYGTTKKRYEYHVRADMYGGLYRKMSFESHKELTATQIAKKADQTLENSINDCLTVEQIDCKTGKYIKMTIDRP